VQPRCPRGDSFQYRGEPAEAGPRPSRTLANQHRTTRFARVAAQEERSCRAMPWSETLVSAGERKELSETCGPPTNRTSADGGPYVLPLGELYTGLPCRGVTAMKSASRWLTKRSPDCCTNSFTSSTANGSKMACEARACAAFDAHRRQTASVPFGRDPAEAVRRSVGRAPLAHGFQ
jgi:hypothetical protein